MQTNLSEFMISHKTRIVPYISMSRVVGNTELITFRPDLRGDVQANRIQLAQHSHADGLFAQSCPWLTPRNDHYKARNNLQAPYPADYMHESTPYTKLNFSLCWGTCE